MAKEEPAGGASGHGGVQITIVVVPGRIRATLTRLLARAHLRAGLVAAGLVVAGAVGLTIAVSSSGGRAVRSNGLATQFGLRSNCARLTVVSPDGAYARIDLDRAGPCGMFGNQSTLVLHRLHGTWVRELEASSWTCPISRLPERVAIELQLCGSKRGAPSTGEAAP